MSRTTKIQTAEKGPVFVHHNSDWSGMATIVLPFEIAEVEKVDGRQEVRLPGEVLLKLSQVLFGNVARDKLIAAVEQIDFGEEVEDCLGCSYGTLKGHTCELEDDDEAP